MELETVVQMSCARIPTDYGEFRLCLYRSEKDKKEHLAMIMGDVSDGEDVLVRVHSECFTGDVMGSRRCDCGAQLQRSLDLVAEAGRGVVLYLRQEGRGIGLLDKLRAYNLQDEGYDTVDANLLLGHEPDERDYRVAVSILHDLSIHSIRLLTNNPNKVQQMTDYGIEIIARVPLEIPANADNESYLRTKSTRLHHHLSLDIPGDGSGQSDTNRSNGRST
ncbi:MAG: GTP cyclohydrolase II [Anaerolineales bacterium]